MSATMDSIVDIYVVWGEVELDVSKLRATFPAAIGTAIVVSSVQPVRSGGDKSFSKCYGALYICRVGHYT